MIPTLTFNFKIEYATVPSAATIAKSFP